MLRSLLTVTCLLLLAGPALANPAAVVTVQWGNQMGTGTVVASAKGCSTVVTCNHVLTAGDCRAAYPLACTVRTRDGRTLPAVAVDGDNETDVAALVVAAELPAAELAAEDAAPGADVVHYGNTSKCGRGKVLPVPPYNSLPKCAFASSCPSISGDSGAGVFCATTGRMVAVLCGRHGMDARSPMRGVPVSAVLRVVNRACGRYNANPKAFCPCGPACPCPGGSCPANCPPRAAPAGGCPGGSCPGGVCRPSPAGFFRGR
jgi:hypothetical protein